MKRQSARFALLALIGFGFAACAPRPDTGVLPAYDQGQGRTLSHGLSIGYWGTGDARLSPADRYHLTQATAAALTHAVSGTVITWRNEVSNSRGTVVPRTRYMEDSGALCRNFTQTAVVSGQTYSVDGLACQDPQSGRWELRT